MLSYHVLPTYLVHAKPPEPTIVSGLQAAEGAVQEEMEAASVAQETQSALTKALENLTNMEIRFQENSERSNQERTRARISAKVRIA